MGGGAGCRETRRRFYFWAKRALKLEDELREAERVDSEVKEGGGRVERLALLPEDDAADLGHSLHRVGRHDGEKAFLQREEGGRSVSSWQERHPRRGERVPESARWCGEARGEKQTVEKVFVDVRLTSPSAHHRSSLL